MSKHSEDLEIRGSICSHFWLSTFAPGATRGPFFQKRVAFHKKCSSENVNNNTNWHEMGPGLSWGA